MLQPAQLVDVQFMLGMVISIPNLVLVLRHEMSTFVMGVFL